MKKILFVLYLKLILKYTNTYYLKMPYSQIINKYMNSLMNFKK